MDWVLGGNNIDVCIKDSAKLNDWLHSFFVKNASKELLLSLIKLVFHIPNFARGSPRNISKYWRYYKILA